jgi:tetratricopeptide (TPR) repeat protein/transcriptional regulator with XRE-family HTH domain
MAGTNMSSRRTFGVLLRDHRLAANLTQEDLAERSGLSVEAISALERGDRRSPRPSTVEFLATALKLDARQRDIFIAAARGQPIPAVSPGEALRPYSSAPAWLAEAQALLASMPTNTPPERGPLPVGSRMPLAPNPLFVGRGDELLQVARALLSGGTTVALGHVVAYTGLGGLGKTQLAVELVHRYGRFFAGGVFWLSFASASEIPLEIATCGGPGAMDLATRIDNLSLEERVQSVQRAWQSVVPRLLVFDNCEEESLLEAWRPPSGGCRVLVTSRRPRWSPTLGVITLQLDLLPRSASIELLLRYRPDLAAGDPGLDAIAHELGDLPLAIHMAGSYLRAYRAEISIDRYLAELRRSEIVQHASLLGAGLDVSPSPTRHVQSVAQTFALGLGRLDRELEVDRVAIALLARMACMAPGEPVPRDLLSRTLEEVGPFRRADGLRRLEAVGLVEEREGWLRLHRLLVHFVRQEDPDPTAWPAVARALIGCGEDACRGHMASPALATVIPHLVSVAGAAARDSGDERVAAELCTAVGQVLLGACDFRAARLWYECALTIWEKVSSPAHPDTARGLTNLAWLLYNQGELAAARPLVDRALAIRERALGPDHPLTSEGLNNVGVLLLTQGNPTAAKPLLERALDISERVLGPGHAVTARNLHNLAAVLRDQGHLDAAKALFERALSIRERVLRADHPETAFTLHGLGRLLHATGELDAARAFLERALDMRKRVLGPDHPHTAISLNDLALLRRAQGDPAAARPLFERALAIRERVLGSDHPDTVATRRALAELAQGDGPATGA